MLVSVLDNKNISQNRNVCSVLVSVLDNKNISQNLIGNLMILSKVEQFDRWVYMKYFIAVKCYLKAKFDAFFPKSHSSFIMFLHYDE